MSNFREFIELEKELIENSTPLNTDEQHQTSGSRIDDGSTSTRNVVHEETLQSVIFCSEQQNCVTVEDSIFLSVSTIEVVQTCPI